MSILRNPRSRRLFLMRGGVAGTARVAARALATLLVATSVVTLLSCGDGGDGEGGGDSAGGKGKSASTALFEDAEGRLKGAGENVLELKKTRDWLDGRMKSEGMTTSALQQLRSRATRKIIDSFETLASATDGNSIERAQGLIDWSEPIVESAKASPKDQRDELGAGLAPQLQYLYDVILTSDPSRDDLRLKLGYEEFTVDLAALRKATYIDEDDDIEIIEDVEASVGKIQTISPSGKKWLPPAWKGRKKLADAVALAGKRKAEFEERMKDPFEKSSAKLLAITKQGLGEILNTSYQWVGRTYKPYLIIVEKDKGWDESDVAREKADQLHQLMNIFYDEYRELLSLQDIKVPVPVVLFKKHAAYRAYAVKRGADKGAIGHFEHDTGRLLVSEETERDTLFHEGTHQIIAFNTGERIRVDFLTRSYWFQEGVAEYFGATHIELDPATNKWKYELGRLQMGRLSSWRNNEHKAYKLWDLLDLTYRTREKNKTEGNEDLNGFAYSQGWFLIYFLNNYLIDDEGVVQIGKKGKHHEKWLKYFQGELDGKTGRPFFLQTLGLWKDGAVDQEKFNAFEKEFVNYYNWMNRKSSMKYHTKERELIPWDKVTNKGRMIGEKIDDMIVPPGNADGD